MNYDVIVIGGGPAGLSAGTGLASASYSVLLLSKESFGGSIVNVEWVANYPTPGKKTAGPMLASALVKSAEAAGVVIETAEVVEVEPYSECVSVTCDDGRTLTASAVVIAGGLNPKKLGLPKEDALTGKGVIHCAMCDAGLYRDRVVAVCGGGDAGLIEAMYLSRFASKVHVFEMQPKPTAHPDLQSLAALEAKIEMHCSTKPVEILGGDGVSGLVVEDSNTGVRRSVDVYGVLARVGFDPSSTFVDGVVSLDEAGHIHVDARLQTDVPGIFAAGDIRSGSPRGVLSAVSDGAVVAASARQYLAAKRG